ncbi:MAG TPA: molybdenum cofactor guanylyltransferase [Fimbriiglobus sp.]
MRVAGVVLCGGKSSRMGRPKAWLPFGNELMLQRVVRVLGEVVHPVIVVAAAGQDVPPLPADVTIVRDDVEAKGPLGGLAAGLNAAMYSADAVYLSACDVPFLTPAFAKRVIDLLGDHSSAVPKVDGYFHPLAAVYCVSVRPKVLELLQADRLRPIFLFDAVPTRVIEPAELPELESLKNLNTLADYEAAVKAM